MKVQESNNQIHLELFPTSGFDRDGLQRAEVPRQGYPAPKNSAASRCE